MHYTIRISKAGVQQYRDIKFSDTGELLTKSVRFNYTKDDLSLENCQTIDDVLKVLADFSYNKKADVWKINGVNPEFHSNYQKYNDAIKKVRDDIDLILLSFYNEYVVPLVPSRSYKKDISEHKNFNHINFLCYKLLYSLNLVKHNSFDSETNYNQNYYQNLKDRVDF